MSNKLEFTNSQILDVQRRLLNGEPKSSLARELGVHHSVITRMNETTVSNRKAESEAETSNGRGPGRPPKLNDEQVAMAADLYNQNAGSVEIAAALVEQYPELDKVTPTTVIASLRRAGVKIRSVGRPMGSTNAQ